MGYIAGPRDESCFICRALEERDDEANLVLARREAAVALLNKYPYNSGHVIVATNRHVGELTELNDAEKLGLFHLVTESVRALEDAAGPEGFNIGINLGSVAGAGLPGHLHVHVVPRWSGDTNFMPVIGEAKVIPEDLDSTYERLRPRFE
jgi:ATP adenylyltransferase